MADPFVIGANPIGTQIKMYPRMSNRHGLIAGATGTGKTVTLQVLAEQFSNLGVPVFMVDVKGDLSGIAAPGKEHPKITERIDKIKLENHHFCEFPIQFWDVFSKDGTPARTTIADMGAVLLSHLLELNETQAGVMTIAFLVAEKRELPLLNLDDLRSMLNWLSDNAKEVSAEYGNVSTRSVGAIQRRLLSLSQAGADVFFGEPALDVAEFIRCDDSGRGIINILSGKELILNPTVYGTFLFWLLTELFTTLPEVGDADKPKLVFFFDEAHLLFDSAPDSLIDRIEQVVRLIRSKGVGIYFITQSPSDIPDDVLGQLGNRIQHALRAFTPKDQKAVKVAAETFRPNPNVDVVSTITSLGVGEALVSVLDDEGTPTPVEEVLMCPPQSQIGPVQAALKMGLIHMSALHKKYETPLDRESAYEILKKRQQEKPKVDEVIKVQPKKKSSGRKRQGYAETLGKSVLRTVGTQIGRNLTKAILGSLFGKRR